MMSRIREWWRNSFESRILERGEDYYKRGLVHELQEAHGTVKAVVSGSEEYEVSLEIVDGEVIEMHCTCPYADSGANCKHMAAVCLAAGDNFDFEPPSSAPEVMQDKSLKKLLARLKRPQMKRLLLTLASDDKDIENKIRLLVTRRLPEGYMQALKAKVDDLTDRAEDVSGYIDYRNAWDYTSSLEDFLERETEPLLQYGFVMEAFELTCYTFFTAAAAEMDDSDGGLTSLGECCASLWEEQINEATFKQRAAMYARFEEVEASNKWVDELLQRARISLFRDKALMGKALAKTRERLAAAEQKLSENAWSGQYERNCAVMDCLSLMERLKLPPEELTVFRTRYRYLPEVRMEQTQTYIHSRQYDKAIALLKECKTIDAEAPALVAQYSKTLIELYEKVGQSKELEEELRYQVFSCQQQSLCFVTRLKALMPAAQWSELLEELLSAKAMQHLRLALLESEELWERLLDELTALKSCQTMDRYEKALKKRYPEEVKAFYFAYVREHMPMASGRGDYRVLIYYLNKAAKYPNGRQQAQELAEEWRKSFSRRRSMLDELTKAGF